MSNGVIITSASEVLKATFVVIYKASSVIYDAANNSI